MYVIFYERTPRAGRGGGAWPRSICRRAPLRAARHTPHTTTRRRALSRGKSPVVRYTSLCELATDRPAMYRHHPPRRRSSHERFWYFLLNPFSLRSVFRGASVCRHLVEMTNLWVSCSRPPAKAARCFEKHLANKLFHSRSNTKGSKDVFIRENWHGNQ